MDDWFNNNNNNDPDKEKRVGRIFQEDNDFQGADLMNDFNIGKDTSSRSRNFDDYKPSNDVSYDRRSFDDILQSSNENIGRKPLQNSDSFDTAELDFSAVKSQIESKESANPVYSQTEITGDIDSKRRKTKKVGGKSKAKKIVLSLIAILLVLVLVVTGYVFKLFSAVNYMPESHKANEYISSSELKHDDDVYNILIIGTDERESQENYRSDTMILASIDKKNGKIKLTSFLRDMWTYIPARDRSAKLNATCSYGGPQMVMDTLEYHFKVKIDKYVMINFDVFKTVINDLGGITLTITEAEAANITKEAGFNCKSGTRLVKGRTALWYARIRHLDSDFNRTARQRKVIQAVIDKAKQSSIPTLMKVLDDVLPEIQTDINKTEMAKLGVNAFLKYLNYDIEEQQIPAKGTWSNAWVGSQQVLKADFDENEKILKKFIYE